MSKSSRDPCVISAYATVNGYARLRVDGRVCGHHCVIAEQRHGPRPKGCTIYHSCHVRNCINPNHIFYSNRAGSSRMMRGPSQGTQSFTKEELEYMNEREQAKANYLHKHTFTVLRLILKEAVV